MPNAKCRKGCAHNCEALNITSTTPAHVAILDALAQVHCASGERHHRLLYTAVRYTSYQSESAYVLQLRAQRKLLNIIFQNWYAAISNSK